MEGQHGLQTRLVACSFSNIGCLPSLLDDEGLQSPVYENVASHGRVRCHFAGSPSMANFRVAVVGRSINERNPRFLHICYTIYGFQGCSTGSHVHGEVNPGPASVIPGEGGA